MCGSNIDINETNKENSKNITKLHASAAKHKGKSAKLPTCL